MSKRKKGFGVDDEAYDSLKNSLSEAILGFNPQSIGVQLSQTDTLFKNNRWYLISNMRQLLSELYAEHGLVQTVCDVPVDDGLRGGIEISTKQLSEDDISELMNEIEAERDLDKAGYAAKWNRLFGGGGVLIITDQDPSTPLDVNAIGPDTPLEFRDVDMWELFWTLQNTSDYARVIDVSETLTTTSFNYYGVQVHPSRVLVLRGLRAPSFVRPRLRGWGLSVLEIMVRSINQYLKSTDLTFEVLDEFKLNIYKIKNFSSTLMKPGGTETVQRRVQLANLQKNYQNAIAMDSEDDFDTKELSFAGISETMAGIRMQVASDLRMPLTKIFGISSAGFNSGEDDIENYNSMIESTIRGKLKFHILKMVELRCQRKFGFIPDDIKISFKPLRILSAEQEENVKTQKFARVLQAKQAGLISSFEFREAVNKDNLLPIQLEASDAAIEEASEESNQQGDDAAGKASAPKAKESTLEAPTAKNSIEEPEIVTVGITCNGKILTGKRNDNGLWVNPGGHIDEGETPEEAACREVLEEAGIDIEPSMLVHISSERVRSHRTDKNFIVHAYTCEVPAQYAKTVNDPDQEVSVWRWVDINPDTPELKPESRHAKKDHVLSHLFRLENSLEFDVAAYQVDGGDQQFDPWRERQVDRLPDKNLVKTAIETSKKAFGKVKWQFVIWFYRQKGGKI